VNAHLTAHKPHLQTRLNNYDYIASTLLFPSNSSSAQLNSMYDSTHLFFFGDLNFRVVSPKLEAAESSDLQRTSSPIHHKELDQLTIERNKPPPQKRAITYLREGRFWDFPATYKFELGSVGKYSGKRTPSWTDRVLYATVSDPVDDVEVTQASGGSVIENIVYTSVPSYTTSDHKPIVALLQIHANPNKSTNSIPSLKRHPLYSQVLPKPDPYYAPKRYLGKFLGWILGWTWFAFVKLGGGFDGRFGVMNFLLGLIAWRWWNQGKSGVALEEDNV